MNLCSAALRAGLSVAMSAAATAACAAPSFAVAPYPLFLAPSINANLMVIFDNSQSMDATMGGKVISGNDPITRSNIARTVLRGVIDANRYAFNWGLTTFETLANTLYNTQAYYLGNAASMVYTNTCVDGVSNVSDPEGNLRCVELPAYLGNPNGFRFITYKVSGDDADINDVYYTNNPLLPYGQGLYGVTFKLSSNRDNTTDWADTNFSGTSQQITFTPTDAGFLPNGDSFKRGLFLNRGWGYYGDITGQGKINEVVQPDTNAHFNALQSLLAGETNGNTTEIKNSALFTPLAGSLQTVRDYFQGSSAANKSPISQSCQSNYVVLATDGNPTGTTSGTQYDPSEWGDKPPNGALWGKAHVDVFNQITALRKTALTGPNLSNAALANQEVDIQTYVIGMGDTVDNPRSVAALNEMARLGNKFYPTAFLGNSAAQLQNAFQSILGNIQAQVGSGAAVALNTGTWAAGASVYQAKFNSTDWSGDLLSYPVKANGEIDTANPAWAAANRLKAQNWDTGRRILTYKRSAPLGQRGIGFRWPANPLSPTASELDADQAAYINQDAGGATDGFGASRLGWLRGDPSREIRNCGGCAAPVFRSRAGTPLGDIISSSPYYVAGPDFGYLDSFEAQPYSAFAAANSKRTKMIYAGANDGMLHGFNAVTGDEAFAYVPAAVYASLSLLSTPAYTHHYYADGSPTVGDVFYANQWHTLLVAGMRSGAKGVYALDVTDPTNFSENAAASVVRWEFQDPDLGYVFGQPLLVKTNNGRWSVIVSGGYNAVNASGHALLFVLDAETGALVSKIDTGQGTAASPNGLSGPAAIDSTGDGIVDTVYAGDLNGNLWKFDLSSATVASWGLGNGGLALFSTPGGQPITSRPDVTRFPRGGYLVGFGTGRYLATGDQTDTSAQAIYAIRDTGVAGTVALASLQQQRIVATGTAASVDYRLSSHAVDPPADRLIAGDNLISRVLYYANEKGWYINLPTSGERVVSDARFRAGRLVMTSLIPDTATVCSFGGTGWLLEFDAFTGNRLDTITFDTNADSQFDNLDYVNFPVGGGGLNNVSGRRLDAISAAPGFIKIGNREDRVVSGAKGELTRVAAPLDVKSLGRAMWREAR